MHAQIGRNLGRIFQRLARCIFRRQHHATHIGRAQRIGGNRGDNRGIDAAGQPQQNLFEPGLGHIVAQGHDHCPIILFDRQRCNGAVALYRLPPLRTDPEIDMDHCFLEHRQLHRQPPAPVQHERTAVEHLIILAAHHVQIDQR